ncbi:unnamed protein product [Oikopleura dioica]|uniref:Uncharacterized protein n=1 Tax=Oikopleura dioica TaxID=34765 RepID=E4WSA4_OIKDI|nr:unnamed protein product [Oikopleura dioica]CBY43735.1 unnamed protein product [Oikopleura dioica]
MGGRRKGRDPNHGNSTMVKMRRFMVQTKKAEVTKYKELDPIILANLWTLCQITMAKLKFPIEKDNNFQSSVSICLNFSPIL